MDEPAATLPVVGNRLSFSLRQIIAVTTSVAAAIALCYTLQSPPLGSNGLFPALLPGFLLVGSLWFCRSVFVGRLGTYTVVASLLALHFFGSYLGQTDWLFGHTQGPPQLIIATCLASAIGVLTGLAWMVLKLRTARRIGAATVVLLTLLSGLLAFVSFTSLPQAQQRMDSYIKQRQVRADVDATRWARARESARDADRLKTQAALIRDLDGKDEAARYQAALTILADNGSEEQQARLTAIEIIGASQGGADVDKAVRGLLRAISDAPPKDPCRIQAIRSLGRIGPKAAPAVPRLALMVYSESQRDADVRSEAAKALGLIGPAAKEAVPLLGRAWQDHRLTVEDAQAMYKIDPKAAEEFQIPRPAAPR